jgi:hypothetical protein
MFQTSQFKILDLENWDLFRISDLGFRIFIIFNPCNFKNNIASIRASHCVNGIRVLHKEELRPEIQGKQSRESAMKCCPAKTGNAF